MYCHLCNKDIPCGEDYFRVCGSDECFCSVDCLSDHMIFTGRVNIETIDGEEEDENE